MTFVKNALYVVVIVAVCVVCCLLISWSNDIPAVPPASIPPAVAVPVKVPTTKTKPQAKPQPQPDAIDNLLATKEGRDRAVRILLDTGVIKSIDTSNGSVVVEVNAPFIAGTQENKIGLSAIFLAWGLDRRPSTIRVVFRDPRTNQNLGTFNLTEGLNWY
jgi:hypothetical protein